MCGARDSEWTEATLWFSCLGMTVELGALQLASCVRSVGFAAALLGACVGCENTDPAEVEEADADEAQATFVLEDVHNHSARSSYTIPEIETSAGADLNLDWSAFSEDLYGRVVSPAADVDSVALLRFRNTDPITIAARLGSNELGLADIDASFLFVTDHVATTATLSALLDSTGAPMNIAASFLSGAGYTYLLALASGTTPGLGIRSMTFLEPSTASANTTVQVGAATGVRTQTVNLGREALALPVTGPWTIDWSGLTRDSFGAEIPIEGIDSLMLGYYQGVTADALIADYYGLVGIPTRKWTLELDNATSASLGMAKEVMADNSAGANFAGFEGMTDGVWLFLLKCSACTNPAPPVLVVLEPVATP